MIQGCFGLEVLPINLVLPRYEIKAVQQSRIQRFLLWQAQVFAAPLAPDPILRYTPSATITTARTPNRSGFLSNTKANSRSGVAPRL